MLYLKSSVAAIAINNLVIIGVYLVYRDGTKNIEQFENELSIINETVKKYEDLGFKCIILGDFNVRGKLFGDSMDNSRIKTFKEFMEE